MYQALDLVSNFSVEQTQRTQVKNEHKDIGKPMRHRENGLRRRNAYQQREQRI